MYMRSPFPTNTPITHPKTCTHSDEDKDRKNVTDKYAHSATSNHQQKQPMIPNSNQTYKLNNACTLTNQANQDWAYEHNQPIAYEQDQPIRTSLTMLVSTMPLEPEPVDWERLSAGMGSAMRSEASSTELLTLVPVLDTPLDVPLEQRSTSFSCSSFFTFCHTHSWNVNTCTIAKWSCTYRVMVSMSAFLASTCQ